MSQNLITKIVNRFHSIKQNKIVSALFALASIGALVKVLGFIEKIVLANYIGTSYQADAYTVVFTFIFSLFIIFRELIEPAFLNVFTNSLINRDKKTASGLFNISLRFLLIITLCIALAGVFFPNIVIRIIAPGFVDEKREITALLVKLMLPAVIFMVLSNVTKITLNGLKLFALPASGDLVFKTGIIVGLVVFYKSFGLIAVTIGILTGAVGRLAVHFIKLYPWFNFKKSNLDKPTFQQIWKLTWPLLIGALFSQLSVIIDNNLASHLEDGSISSLSYAKKIMETPLMFFSEQLGIILFPFFTQFALNKNSGKMVEMFGASIHWMTLVLLPISIFFVVFSTPIIEIIYQRGEFNAESTILTVQPFVIYSLGMVIFAIDTVITVFYFGCGDTKTPVFVGIACVIINIISTYIFINLIGYIAIPIAFLIQKFLKVTCLLLIFKIRHSPATDRILFYTIRLLISAGTFGVVTVVLKYLLNNINSDQLLNKMIYVGLSFSISTGIYFIIIYSLKLLNVKLRQ